MVARTVKLTRSGVGTLGRWITGERRPERFEKAAQSPSQPLPTGPDFVEFPASVDLENDDYGASLDRQNIPMEWVGSGAEDLGLNGDADIKALARTIQHGTGPEGQALRTDDAADADQKRICAFGIVWSPPKTVSLLMASRDAAIRDTVQKAVRAASDRYIETLERLLTVRRGKGGVRSERITGLIAVRALHQTTSAGDPHLHAHFIVAANAASAADGAYRAIDGRMMFQAQKLAEAAANALLQQQLQTHLGITDWTLKEAGSVPVYEIAALEPAAAPLSQARAHMQDIAQKMGVPFALRSRKMDAGLWRRHRERKAEIAEALEHRMDEALHEGGDAAQFIREQWRSVIDAAGVALDAIQVRASRRPPKPVPDLTLLNQPLESISPEEEAWAVAAIARNPGGKIALAQTLASLALPLHIRAQAALGFSAAKTKVAEIEARRQAIDTEMAALDRAQSILVRAAHQREVQDVHTYARALLRTLTEVLGTFTPTDVAARLVAVDGLALDEAQKAAARLLRFLVAQGLLHPAQGMDVEAACTVLENGGISAVTADNHRMTRTRSLVPDRLIREENALATQAHTLSAVRRASFVVPVPKDFTQEQASAAALLAQGRALSVTVGVAGAGKTFLARPVVAAAQRQGFQVRVLARNRSLAEALKEDLRCNDAQVFASFDPEQGKGQKTLLIVDEAGLADRSDLKRVLDAVEKTPNWQVWLIGDRAQAQPIDRLASFAVVEQAVAPDALCRLTTSYRCAAWAEEHALLRSIQSASNPAAVAALVDRIHREGRVLTVNPDTPESRPAQLAALAEQYRDQGEDVLVLCRDNASAATIAEYIQAHRGVSVDLRSALRFDQKAGIGDQVRTRRNDRHLGVRNGDLWTVRAVDAEGTLTLQSLKNPRRIVCLPKDYTQDALELAYAATADSAQGVTVDRVIVDTTGMGRSLLYSAATRGRQAPVLLVASAPEEAAKALSAVLQQDDVAETMREILGPQRQILEREIAGLRHMDASGLAPDLADKLEKRYNAQERWRRHPEAMYLQPEISAWETAWKGWQDRVTAHEEQQRREAAERERRAQEAREHHLASLRAQFARLIAHYRQAEALDDPETEAARWRAVGYKDSSPEYEASWRRSLHPRGALVYHPETFALKREQKALEAAYAPLVIRRERLEALRTQVRQTMALWTQAPADPLEALSRSCHIAQDAATQAGVSAVRIRETLESALQDTRLEIDGYRRRIAGQIQRVENTSAETDPETLADAWERAGYVHETHPFAGAWGPTRTHPFANPLHEELERLGNAMADHRQRWQTHQKSQDRERIRQGIQAQIQRLEQATGETPPDTFWDVWEQAGWQRTPDDHWTHPFAGDLGPELQRLSSAWDAYHQQHEAHLERQRKIALCRKHIIEQVNRLAREKLDTPELRAQMLQAAGYQYRPERNDWSHPYAAELTPELSAMKSAWQQLKQRGQTVREERIRESVNLFQAMTRDVQATGGWQPERDGPRLHQAGFTVQADGAMVPHDSTLRADDPSIQAAQQALLDAIRHPRPAPLPTPAPTYRPRGPGR